MNVKGLNNASGATNQPPTSTQMEQIPTVFSRINEHVSSYIEHDLKIGSLNVRGLLRKVEYPDFLEVLKPFDVFCVGETFLDGTENITIPGYDFISKPRKAKCNRKSGGIGVFLKSSIASNVEVIDSQSEYCLWLKFQKCSLSLESDLVIGSIYIPPEQSKFCNDDEWQLLCNEIADLNSQYSYLLMTGDMNARTGHENDFITADTFLLEHFGIDEDYMHYIDPSDVLKLPIFKVNRSSQDKSKNSNGRKLLDVCQNNNLFILNGRCDSDKDIGQYTYRDSSVIDYSVVSASCAKLVKSFSIQETDDILSDGHSLVTTALQVSSANSVSPDPQPVNRNRPHWDDRHTDHFISKINIEKVHDLIRLSQVDSSDDLSKINKIANEITTIFESASNETFQSQSVRNKHMTTPNHKPWFNHRCRNHRAAYNRAKRLYNKHKTPTNKSILKTTSKLYKRTMNAAINTYKAKMESQIRKLEKQNPKQYWKFINNIKVNKSNEKSATLSDFYMHFKNVNKSNDVDNEPDTFSINDGIDELNRPITPDEILKCVKHLKNGKCPAGDRILNEHIKSTVHVMLPLYVQYFNLIMETGILPDTWTTGIIKPIYKNKGDPIDPVNYRPITIVSCLGKVFTSVLNERLTAFLEDNEMLLENQAGFRKHHSTTDHIFVLHSLIEFLNSSKKKLYCGFVDFTQAFDSVWRTGLWQKLIKHNVNGKFFRLVRNMYLSIKSCVEYNNEYSAYFNCQRGVRQGENLSPVLFAIFLNDLETELLSNGNNGITIDNLGNDAAFYIKIITLLYADDTVIFSEDPDLFQKSLNDFNDYCNKWKLNINTSKTKVIVFGSKHNVKRKFKIGNSELEIVNSFKYLGVIFSRSGSFLKARKHVIQQARKAMHLLFTRINNLDLPIDLQIKLFDSTIVPILTYGSEIWGFENLQLIENVHTEFLRRITHSRKSTPIYILYAELGRYPLQIVIKMRMVSFWLSLVNCEQTKLSTLMYQHMFHSDIHTYKWIRQLKSILDETGNTNVWLNQNNLHSASVKTCIKRKLIDHHIQNWNSSLQKSNKSKHYSIFKSNTQLEKYLLTMPKHLSMQLYKFRSSNHKLPIETGRWLGIDHHLRKCNLCNRNDLGDEFHYLFNCKKFDNDRNKYLKKYYITRPNMFKYEKLMNSNSFTTLKNLALFVTKIMKTFE